MSDLKIDDLVCKRSGYKFNGSVRAVFQKLDGQTRYVVENPDGILHIFNRGQLALERDYDESLDSGREAYGG